MPKASGRRKSSKSNFIPYSFSILHRIARASRQINEVTCPLSVARRPFDADKSYRHSLGLCNVVCSFCHAMHWIQERSYKSTINDPLFFACCQRGQIVLPSFSDASEPLKSLLQDQTESIYIY